jgi:hypothetical protein
MGKGGAPTPPDPYETAGAQTQQNFFTGLMNQSMGTTNQTTPYGSLTFDKTGTESLTAPDGTVYKVPKYSATTSLSPDAQGAVDANIGASRNMAELAQQQSGRLGEILGSQPDIRDVTGTTRDGAMEAIMSRLAPQFDQDRESLRSSLVNQGIREGSEAFDRAMGRHGQQVNDARMQAVLGSGQEQSRAIQNEIALRSAPINEIMAAMSGGQVQGPSFVNTPSSGIDNVDQAGLIMDNYNAKMQQYQMQQAQQQQLLGGLLGLGGNLAMAFSDGRLKEDVEKVGETNDGQNIYSYRFKGSPKTEIGLLAQEVRKRKPDAVKEGVGGLLMVDYKKAVS